MELSLALVSNQVVEGDPQYPDQERELKSNSEGSVVGDDGIAANDPGREQDRGELL